MKVFYVVCSPVIHLPSRAFLAEDQQSGFIQSIYIYQWYNIPLQKLKLLHNIGTKIILHKYIRKLSSAGQLPMYRVQDPDQIEIVQTNLKKRISEQKLRNMGKILFSKGHWSQCLTIYQFLLLRKCSQVQIVFSNIGLVYRNLNQIQKAIQYFKKSLKAKKNLKAEYQLAMCYINKGNIKQSQNIVDQIDSCPQNQQLKKLIYQMKAREQINLIINQDVIKKTNKQHDQKIVNVSIGKTIKNQSGFINIVQIQEYLLLNKQVIQQDIQQKFQTNKQFLKKIQYLLKTPQILQNQINSSQISRKRFKQFYSLAYLLQQEKSLTICMFLKMNYFAKRIQKYCLKLQQQGLIKQAILIYQSVGYLCPALNIKLAELLRNEGQIQQSINCCERILFNQRVKSIYLCCPYYQGSLILQLSKSQRQLNKIDIKKIQQLIQNIGKRNILDILGYNQYTQKYENYQRRNLGKANRLTLQQSLKEIQNHLSHFGKSVLGIKKKVYLQIAKFLAENQQFERSLNYINKIIAKQSQNKQFPQIYLQSILVKIKIMKVEQKIKQAKKLIQSVLKQIKNGFKSKNDLRLYKKQLLKQKILIQIEEATPQKLIESCKQIIELSQKNFPFILRHLSKFIFQHQKQGENILQLVKKSQVLFDIYQQLNLKFLISHGKYSRKNQNLKEQIVEKSQINQQQGIDEGQLNQKIEEVLEQIQIVKQSRQKAKKIETVKKQFKELEISLQGKFQGLEGYITNFKERRSKKQFIVIIEPSLYIEKQIMKKFIIASQKICTRSKSQSGIKLEKDKSVTLKIVGGQRLTGKLIEKGNLNYCIFNKLESYDEYKRSH